MNVSFFSTASPLVARMTGGDALVGSFTNITLNASSSFDPDMPFEPITGFNWTCQTAGGGPCTAPGGAAVTLAQGSPVQYIQLEGDLLDPGRAYVVSVTVSKGPRTARVAATLNVVSSQSGFPGPTVTVDPLPQARANPSRKARGRRPCAILPHCIAERRAVWLMRRIRLRSVFLWRLRFVHLHCAQFSALRMPPLQPQVTLVARVRSSASDGFAGAWRQVDGPSLFLASADGAINSTVRPTAPI